MKKIIFAVMAFVAIGFMASCGNKTQQGEAIDSVALADSLATEAAQADIDAISGLLDSGDANKLGEALATVKEKIATLIKENPEVAKEYVAKVQDFLKENADKVKSVVGDNAVVQAAVSAITEAEPSSIVSGLLEQVDNAKDAATGAAESVKDAAVDAANEKVEEAKAAVTDKANEAKETAQQKVEDTKAAAKQKASDAVDNAAAAAKKKLGI